MKFFFADKANSEVKLRESEFEEVIDKFWPIKSFDKEDITF